MTIPSDVIDREHVLAAMSRIDTEGVPLINQSRGVEVQHHNRSYPPKYLLSLAFEIATGSALPFSQFITTEAEYKLRGLGFSVVRTTEPTSATDSSVPAVEPRLTTYTFKIVVEPDEDRWRAYCPALEDQGAATWGYTREEALRHIREVLEMIVAELVEEGKPVPGNVAVSEEPLVAVTV
jgi:predicted RNase H-like HicB family nuclease